jgi:hypothetical protein
MTDSKHMTTSLDMRKAAVRAELQLSPAQQNVLTNLLKKVGIASTHYVQTKAAADLKQALLLIETVEDFYQLVVKHQLSE